MIAAVPSQPRRGRDGSTTPLMAYIWLTPTRHQEATVGQWVEDPNEPSGWRWANDAPPGDPTVTQMLPVIGYQPADVDPNLMPPEDQHHHGDPDDGGDE